MSLFETKHTGKMPVLRELNWFPHILSPLPAAIAAATTLPILVVLYFLKLRRKEIPVASTLLWKKAIQDLQVNSPFQKLRRNLLLLLQLLLLLLLCLALSRPVSSYTPGVGRVSVILIDRSGSMNAVDSIYGGRTRLEEAKREAKELVDSMQRGATAMVIAFDDKADTMQSFTADTVALRNAIDAITPTDRRTRLKLAYQLAEAQTNFDPTQSQRSTEQPDVYVFSDGRVADAAELAVHGNVQLRPIGSPDTQNVGIVSLSAKRNYENPAQVQIFARLANFGPKPVKADVELRVSPIDPAAPDQHDDFKLRGAAGVDLLPDRWTDQERDKAQRDDGLQSRDSVEFTLDLTTAAVIRVEQKLTQGDGLSADDAAQVIVPPPRPLKLLLVTEGDYFLEKLLSSLNLKEGATMTPAEYESKVPTTYDVIIFDRAYAPRKLPPAGNFIFFGALPGGLKLKQFTDDGRPQFIDSTSVLDWQRDNAMLKGLSLHKLRVLQAEKLDVPPDAQVLIDGVKGPLLVLDHEGHSTILAVAFDLLQSDWPTSPSFPVFMYNALQYLAVGTDIGLTQSYEPGATPSIPRANLLQAAQLISSGSRNLTAAGELKSITIAGPGESREIAIPPNGDVVIPALDHVGVFTTDPPIPQFERLAVNLLDANESNLLPMARSAPGNVGVVVAAKTTKSRLELWWWIIACAALPMLMIEWYVYTRRVHA